LHGKLFLKQPLMEKLRQRCVIFSDKNAHRHTPENKFGRGKTIVGLMRMCVNEGSKLDSAKSIPSPSSYYGKKKMEEIRRSIERGRSICDHQIMLTSRRLEFSHARDGSQLRPAAQEFAAESASGAKASGAKEVRRAWSCREPSGSRCFV
jgi:hypothetical protein